METSPNPNKKVGPDQNPNVSDPLKRILFMTIHVCVCVCAGVCVCVCECVRMCV